MSESDFEKFFAERQKAGEAYINGDFAPLGRILPGEGNATFQSPRGDTLRGASEVAKRYEVDAGSFASGGTGSFEVLDRGESGELAFWTGFQHATVKLKNAPVPPVTMKVRVTEVFRRTRDGWKLIVRHADMPAQK